MATTNFECEFTESYIVDLVYPVGSIYITVESVDPGNLFPNTQWERIQDKFLAASGTLFPSGTEDGSASKTYLAQGAILSHVLSEQEIPSHSHNIYEHKHGSDSTKTTSSDGEHHHDIKADVSMGATSSNEVDIRKAYKISTDPEDPGGTGDTNNGISSTGAHTHTLSGVSGTNNSNTGTYGLGEGHTHSFTPESFTIATLPPYLAVFMWERIS